jgi:hypothetical protein
VRSVRQVMPGERLDIELADGHVAARSDQMGKAEADPTPQSPARRGDPGRSKVKPGSDGSQGSLF